MNEKAKRYAIFAIGLFINSLGVSFITTADLGTSPISSIPYVLSLNAPPSLGQFTILFNLLIVLVQLPILKKQFQWEHWLQVPVTLLFGWFIDLTMVPLATIAPDLPLEAGLPPPGLPDSGLRGVPGDGGQRGHAPGGVLRPGGVHHLAPGLRPDQNRL